MSTETMTIETTSATTGQVVAEAPDSTTMRAVVHHTYGGSEVLSLGERERPTAGKGEVLVRVHAAGLDRGTWHLTTGTPYAARLVVGLRHPRNPVPGRDLAGVVEAIGPDVTRFKVGDAVYGTGAGSFAEFVVAAEKRLALKPAGLSFEEAAVVPVSGQAALQAVADVGRVSKGQRVLVIGASGGVGTYAVQVAVALGAEVTAVASTAKLDLVRSLGATHTVDYTQEDLESTGGGFDVVIDIAGNTPLGRLRKLMTREGTLVIVGGEGAGQLLGMSRQLRAVALSPFVKQRLTMLVAKEQAATVERLTELVDSGAVKPVLERTYPLDEAPLAMRELEAGHVRGKLAIRP